VRSPGCVPFGSAHGGATSIPLAPRGWIAAILLSLATVPAVAQTIAGRVLDQVTRQVATPVGVRVIDDSGYVVATATTDRTGVFYADLERAARVRVVFDLDSLRAFATDTMSVAEDGFVQREFLIPFVEVFLEFQVEQPVMQRPGNALRYPLRPRGRRESGAVLAQFIVDTSGLARMTSFRVLRSTHPDFVAAVQRALPSFHFLPAVVNGRKVAQLVQQPFDFATDSLDSSRELYARPTISARPVRPSP
jgi:TonB family protein